MTKGLVFAPLVMLLLKGFFYWIVFRFRHIDASYKTCLLLGGSTVFVGIVPAITMGYISFPPLIMLALTIGLGIVLTSRWTDAELFPDCFVIPLAVEISSIFIGDLVVTPLLHSIT